MRFYLDEKHTKVDPELYDKVAREWASRLVLSDGVTRDRSKVPGVSRHQLRRLFEEIKRLQRLSDDGTSWDVVYPQVKMLKSKTGYAVARAKDKDKNNMSYYEALRRLIEEGLALVSTQEDYRVFSLFMESVYGFYYEMGGSKTEK
jgi:CRISPR type III-A-associated protein Csm2